MTEYKCELCGATTDTLNELKWHYQNNHPREYDFEIHIKPIYEKILLEAGPVPVVYPNRYDLAKVIGVFGLVALLPALLTGAITTLIAWDVYPHQTALYAGVASFMVVFFFGGVLSLALQYRD